MKKLIPLLKITLLCAIAYYLYNSSRWQREITTQVAEAQVQADGAWNNVVTANPTLIATYEKAISQEKELRAKSRSETNVFMALLVIFFWLTITLIQQFLRESQREVPATRST